MNSKIQIIETTKKDGIFSDNQKFYKKNTSEIKRKTIFKKTRIKLCKKYGINGSRIIHSTQKEINRHIKYKNGKDIFITNKRLQKKDLWKEKFYCDLLVVSESIKNVIIGQQTADCPIIIIEDRKKGLTLVTHCGGKQINRNLQKQAVEVLINKYNCNEKNLYVYIGNHIKKENYIYNKYPIWATNKKVWKNCIIKENNNYFIDLDLAILNQLKKIPTNNIEISKIDNFSNDMYYSHAADIKGMHEKSGQNFVGFLYK